MTPKEKAVELVEKYDLILPYLESKSKAKQYAMIAVEEIMNSIDAEEYVVLYYYWQKVKQEIENL
jgi:hypothetical protein